MALKPDCKENPMRSIWLALALATLSIPLRAEIHAQADQIRPLLPGSTIPAFTLVDTDGRQQAVDANTLEGPLVLTFYRGGWCPYCNLHLAELRHAEAELRALGFAVWFVSPDRPELLAEGAQANPGYRLFSDADTNAAQAFGVAFRVDDATYEQYKSFGLDLHERAANDHQVLPAGSTFLIGSDGIVQFSYANPDYTVRLPPEVLLAAARAYRADAQDRLRRARTR